MSTVNGNYYGGIVRNGLVLLLDAAKRDSYPKTGTVWTDLSGNGNTGTLTNSTAYNSSNGGSIVFDGTNNYVSLPNSSLLKPTNPTISMWLKPSILNKTQVVFDGGYYNSIAGYLIYTNSTNNFMFYVRNSNNNTEGVGVRSTLSTTVFTTSNWYNVTGVFNGSTVFLYINGVLENSGAMTNPISYTNSNNFLIGNYASALNLGLNFQGSNSNTLLYNRALSAIEVLQNYNALKGRYI